jgi:hypothetical protein
MTDAAGCTAASVRRERHDLFPELEVPWVATTPDASIVGFLFYPLAGPEAVLHPAGTAPDDPHKILWAIASGGERVLDLKGSLRGGDGDGFFEQRFPAHPSEHGPEGSLWYPSTMRVPAPGCWELLLRSGHAFGTVTFRVEPSGA